MLQHCRDIGTTTAYLFHIPHVGFFSIYANEGTRYPVYPYTLDKLRHQRAVVRSTHNWLAFLRLSRRSSWLFTEHFAPVLIRHWCDDLNELPPLLRGLGLDLVYLASALLSMFENSPLQGFAHINAISLMEPRAFDDAHAKCRVGMTSSPSRLLKIACAPYP